MEVDILLATIAIVFGCHNTLPHTFLTKVLNISDGTNSIMKTSRLSLTSCFSLLLCSCGGDNQFQAPPAPSVTAQTVEIRDVVLFETFPGRVEARDTVNLTARVSGVLEQIHFEPGTSVKEGDLLFTI